MTTLEIKDLHVSVVSKEDGTDIPILKGVDLTVKSGETHALMGPNGSGKSTLSYAVAGHPKYTVTSGSITLDGQDVLAMSIDERARAGLFLAMQYPVEVPGVSMSNFLRTAVTAVRGEAPKLAALGQRGQGRDGRVWTSTRRSPNAVSTKAFPAARRSGTRSFSSNCSSPRSRSLTRPTPALTSTR